MSRRAGVTLVEIVVVLAILGIVVGVTAVAVHPATTIASDTVVAAIEAAHQRAIHDGVPVALSFGGTTLRLFPDGSSSGGRLTVNGAGYHLDPLTSEVRRDSR